MPEITKSYEPRDVEKKWYATWEAAGAFTGVVRPDREPYSIVIPPPNVTGVLTMGHVLNATLQDILIRRARLEGKSALWIPGTDHAGIATQTVVERTMRKEKKTRHDFGREKFVEKVWEWREEKGGIILEQLRRLGASCDWPRAQFTMDEHYSRAVLSVFVKLFADQHIYRGKRMVNWCVASLTALSDEEVIMKPVQSTLYRVRYELTQEPGKFIEVKTTRPETIPGDVAIAVHPEDPRYADFIGKTVWRPLHRATIPIIADASVDREFGTGALKITPAHDKVDFEIGTRHRLPIIDVLTAHGFLNEFAGPELSGLERFAGRKRAAEILRENGALVSEEAYANNVGYSERADVPVEPRLTWQWWLKYPRVEEAKAVVRDGLIKFHPERWSKVYLHWLENIQDWCISRQLWWGHRIPVWYRKGLDRDTLTPEELRDPTKVHVSLAGPPDAENWVQEDDVLDTWASSWLWPFATLGWPDAAAMTAAGFDYFYPTSTLVTGPDIIFFWVARMIMAGLEFVRPGEALERRIPFRDVYFTGIIRDQQGRKMSKSLGNSPDPLELIDKYGADGLRFGIISMAPQGQDIRFHDDRIESGKNFCNKLWNACRFRQMGGPAGDNSTAEKIIARFAPEKFDADDHTILDKLVTLSERVATALGAFEFSEVSQLLYGFFWNDFCDWYVEVSKAKLQSPDLAQNCLAIQDLVLRQLLLLLHPIIPFITEELWHLLGYASEEVLIQQASVAFPTAALLLQLKGPPDAEATKSVRRLQEFVSLARTLKAEHNLASRKDVKFVLTGDSEQRAEVDKNQTNLLRLIRAEEIRTHPIPPLDSPVIITPLGNLYLLLSTTVDHSAEIIRLKKESAHLEKQISAGKAKTSNKEFRDKAPPHILEGALQQIAALTFKQAQIAEQLRKLEITD